MRHPFFDAPRPTILGHRGAASSAPENTLHGFSIALEQGAMILETDVRSTRDGVAVLFHDAQLDRTTNESGYLHELDWKQLRMLDAGFHFTPDQGQSFPCRAQGLRVPSLGEALASLPTARFNLEIKECSYPLVRAALSCIAESKSEARVLLAAGDPETMELIHEELARTGLRPALGASSAEVVQFVKTAFKGHEPPAKPMALQIPASFYGHPLVSRELIEHAHRHDVAVHVWTIDEEDEMHRLLDLEVDGIVTNYPERLAGVLNERG